MALLPAHDGAAEQALATLYDRYSATVYGLVLCLTKDVGTADEVVQDAFWRLWLHADRYEAGSVRFTTWLLRISRNSAMSAVRHPQAAVQATGSSESRGDPTAVLTDYLPEPGPAVPELAWLAAMRHAIDAALLVLPTEQRQAVSLAYFGGLSHGEIAAAQGASACTVKTRLALGLKMLADSLASRRSAL